jgi:hypothetical protein
MPVSSTLVWRAIATPPGFAEEFRNIVEDGIEFSLLLTFDNLDFGGCLLP